MKNLIDNYNNERWYEQRMKDFDALSTPPLWDDLTGSISYLPMNIAPAGVPTTEGTLSWNATDHTLNIQSEIADSMLQVGQENWVRCVNKTGSPITNGQAVYVSGAQGNRPTASLAKADAENTSYTIGVATADIANNAEGYVTVFGLVRGYNTSGFTAGDNLWLSASTAGALTNVRPSAPNHGVFVATALNSTNNGSIFVHPYNGQEMDELHDFLKQGSYANGQIITRDETNKYWENSQNITIDDANRTIATNTADLVVDCGSQKTLLLQTPVYDDIMIPLVTRVTGAGTPDFGAFLGSGGLLAYRFDKLTVESIYGTFEMPHSYKQGTNLDVHIHWCPTTTGSGNVVWAFEYSISNIDGTFGTPTTVSAIIPADGTAWKHQYDDIQGDLSGSGINIGAVCNFRLFRNASSGDDTYDADAALISFGIHIQHDTLGSRQELVK